MTNDACKAPKECWNNKLPGMTTIQDLVDFEPNMKDCLISRGEDDAFIIREKKRFHIIAGYPGVGKSRIALNLALCGANQSKWLGYDTNSKFKTLYIQGENGRRRLKRDIKGHEDDLFSTVIFYDPDEGIQFGSPKFRDNLRTFIVANDIGLVVFDTWTDIVPDLEYKHCRQAIKDVEAAMPEDPEKHPAIVVIAHLRKPHPKAVRKRGRSLKHELNGTQAFGARARFVMIVDHVNPDDKTDKRIVAICAKSSDTKDEPEGCFKMDSIKAEWIRDFDWSEYDQPGKPGAKPRYELSDIVELLEPGEAVKSGEWKSRAKEVLGIGESRFYKYQKQAVDEGLVEKLDKANYKRPNS